MREHTLRLSAYPEARSHFDAALSLVLSLPDGEDRDRQELVVQTRLGTILGTAHGLGSAGGPLVDV